MISMTPSSNEFSAYFPPGFEELYEQMGFVKRWPNFSFDELKCKGTGSLRVHYSTMDALQRLRLMIRRPIAINSYYRSPEYNERIGGAPASYHLLGKAVDTTLWNGNITGRAQLVYFATLCGFRGFGFYPTFNHIDTGPARSWHEGMAQATAFEQPLFDENGHHLLDV